MFEHIQQTTSCWPVRPRSCTAPGASGSGSYARSYGSPDWWSWVLPQPGTPPRCPALSVPHPAGAFSSGAGPPTRSCNTEEGARVKESQSVHPSIVCPSIRLSKMEACRSSAVHSGPHPETAQQKQRSRSKEGEDAGMRGWGVWGESLRLRALSCCLIGRWSSLTSSPSSTSIAFCSAALVKVFVFTFLLFGIYEKAKASFNNHEIPSAGRSQLRGWRHLLRCSYLWLCCCSLLAVW